MTSKRRVAGGLSALALACVALLVAALPSRAAQQDVILALDDGTLTIAGNATDLPNNDPAGEGTTTFQGTWDDVTGELAGTLTVPVISIISNGIPIDLAYTQTGGGMGNIDPLTGLGTVGFTLSLNISSPDPNVGPLLGATCNVAPINLTLDVVADLTATPPTFAMTAQGFTVPQAAGCGALDQVINDTLGIGPGGTTDTSAVLNFSQTDVLPPPPTTPPATPPPTPSAQPVVAGQPTLTG